MEKPVLGEYQEGGIVFYTDKKHKKALVVALHDAGQCEWGPLSPATCIKGTNFFMGLENTRKLCALGPEYKAAHLAASCREDGYEDWYLPSKKELYELFKHKDKLNKAILQQGGEALKEYSVGEDNWEEIFYWSSCERENKQTGGGTDSAWVVYGNNGERDWMDKDICCSVRPIRAFRY